MSGNGGGDALPILMNPKERQEATTESKKAGIIIKFGGSVLSNPNRFMESAEAIKKLRKRYMKILVVVSALKGETDEIIETVKAIDPSINNKLLDQILPIGEIKASLLMKIALESKRLKIKLIDPSKREWPIITDKNFGDANPIIDKCMEKVREIEPILEERIVVMPGYVGKTIDGRLSTLGRGGSDATAVLMGKCLGFKEVFLVKDVASMYSANPNIVSSTRKISSVDPRDMSLISHSGAKIVQSKALRFLTEGMEIKIAGLVNGTIIPGTCIYGKPPHIEVNLVPRPISMVTIVHNGKEKILGETLRLFFDNGYEIISISYFEKATIIYFRGEFKRILAELHRKLIKRHDVMITGIEKLALITVSGQGLEESPGVVHKIAEPLSSNGINIFGLQTVHSRIGVFVSWEEGLHGFQILSEVFQNGG